MRFLVDENLPPRCVDVLRASGHEAEHVSSVGLRSSPDERIWSYAALGNAIVVTRDLDFPLPGEPRPRGLVLLRVPDWYQTAQLLGLLTEFMATASESEIQERITVLEPGREPRFRAFDDA